VDGSRLPEPIFTPTTKAHIGDHDEPLTFEEVTGVVRDADVAERLRSVTLEVYRRGAELAAERGIILADTKIELGWDDTGDLVLGDEVLTPDSSRFWPRDGWEPGRAQPSFDKQFVRDWLASPESGWDRASGETPPPLPDEIVERTRSKYVEAYERLTGQKF
jgi:phosphoribosylaminoimidazole-succinocarboxamide synthase